jgi:hypothetical protein
MKVVNHLSPSDNRNSLPPVVEKVLSPTPKSKIATSPSEAKFREFFNLCDNSKLGFVKIQDLRKLFLDLKMNDDVTNWFLFALLAGAHEVQEAKRIGWKKASVNMRIFERNEMLNFLEFYRLMVLMPVSPDVDNSQDNSPHKKF